jgi:hypothetical protein
MDQFEAGDKIEHILVPGYVMTVLDTRDCETDANTPEPHLAYKVTDPSGNEDWLCAYDAQKPAKLTWGTGPRGASFSNGPGSPKWEAGVPAPVTHWDFTEGRMYE